MASVTEIRVVLTDSKEEARNRLVEANLSLVKPVIMPYLGKGLPFDDLLQEGNIGLIRAAEKFDEEKGFEFSTYANWWIWASIQRALAGQTRIIDLPEMKVQELNRVIESTVVLTGELGREPTYEEVGRYLGMSAARVSDIFSLGNMEPISLERAVRGDRTLSDVIEDSRERDFPEKVIERVDASKELSMLEVAQELPALLPVGLAAEIVKRTKSPFGEHVKKQLEEFARTLSEDDKRALSRWVMLVREEDLQGKISFALTALAKGSCIARKSLTIGQLRDEHMRVESLVHDYLAPRASADFLKRMFQVGYKAPSNFKFRRGRYE